MRTFETIVEELVKIEMNPGSHMDNVADYESKEDFILSNVVEDDFVSSYLEESFLTPEEIEAYDLYEIQEAVNTAIRNEFDSVKK